VNTRRTGANPWNVATYLDATDGWGNLVLPPRSTLAADFLEAVRVAVINLPARVCIPKTFTHLSLPRYYLLLIKPVFFKEERVNPIDYVVVKDILGIRRSGAPTKWSYSIGYWHPLIQFRIAAAIVRELKEIEKSLESAREVKEVAEEATTSNT